MLKYIWHMKNVVVYLILCFATSLVYGQVTDTLGYHNFMEGTDTLYESPNGGYVFGNNGYGDLAKAQTFFNDSAFVLRSVLLNFGAVKFQSLDSTSSISVNVYSNTGIGITVFSNSDTLSPDTVIASVEVPVHELVENGITKVDFSSHSLSFDAEQLFSVGIGLEGLVQEDTIGLVSTSDGDAGGTYHAWELTSNNDWIVVAHAAYSWNLDVDMGIFVEIDENDPAGIDKFARNISFSIYPNPVAGTLHVDFSSDDRAREVWVYDLNGRMIYAKKVSNSQVEMDLGCLVDGVYVLRVLDDVTAATTKFVIQH